MHRKTTPHNRSRCVLRARGLALLTLLLFGFGSVQAQVSIGGTPPGHAQSFRADIPEHVLPGLNMDSIRVDDQRREAVGNVPAFGRTLDRQLTLADGRWATLQDGRNIWQLQVRSLGALATSLYFDDFYLPVGSRLFVYTPDGNKILGAFTADNNKASGRFATGLLPGDACVVEYIEPQAYPGRVRLSIEAVGHAYRDVPFAKTRRDFGDSDACQINVNCDEGTGKQNAIDATSRILVRMGNDIGWCSGTLVNNTLEDGTPYLLSAHHCAYDFTEDITIPQTDFDQWVFYFNYESPNCATPNTEDSLPQNSITGGQLVAHSDDQGGETGSDFLLLELSEAPQNTYDVYYAGWDHTDYDLLNPPPGNGFSIHHPAGDLKKISTFNDALIATSYSGNILVPTHWEVRWSATANGHGVTEGGSSGSALFNSNQQILGTLTGGSSFCNDKTAPDLYGKFSYSWASNGSANNRQLQPWLDPNGSGGTTLAGKRFAVSHRPENKTIPLIVKVYPNPSSNRFTLEMLPKLAPGAKVEVYNTLGARVNATVNRDEESRGKISVNLAGNAAGLYFIKLANGRYSTIEKVELMR